MTRKAGIVGANGTRIALKSVHIEGQLDGMLATMAITQRYRNDSGGGQEIVYTFPLAWGAVLLGMEVSLGGKRLRGAIAEKRQAWKRYEEAIDGGDAPILVEQTAPGLYTANLGNIDSGADVIVELRYAQLLRFGHDSLRLAIPGVIAPRCGDQHREGGLAPHENADADMLAEYPLTLRIVLCGQLAGAKIHCPGHACGIETVKGDKVVSVNSRAMLDRDFILELDGLEQRSFTLVGGDVDDGVQEGGFLMLAGFCPNPPREKLRPLRLKILVDCSRTMAGDGIAQTRQALQHVFRDLTPEDYVSYSRFGNATHHECGRLVPCSGEVLERLAGIVVDTQADMGGKDMERALFSTFSNIPMPPASPRSEDDSYPPCVLLVTDGAAWNVDNVVRASRATGHRVFVVGVGSSPAESLLRELAQKTGGACEFVSPNEDISRTIVKMLDRMRGPLFEAPHVDWIAEPVWQSVLPQRLYDGETLHVFASFSELPMEAPVLRWRTGGEEHRLCGDDPRLAQGEAITFLGGAARLAMAGTPEEARELALAYRLVSEHTALFLIHEREGEKSASLPVLHQVPQMMAAGHGGFGTVRRSPDSVPACSPLASQSRARADAQENLDPLDYIKWNYEVRVSCPAERDKPKGLGAGRTPFERMNESERIEAWAKGFDGVLFVFERLAAAETDWEKMVQVMANMTGSYYLPHLISRIESGKRLPTEQAWALLLHWLLVRRDLSGEYPAERIIRHVLEDISDEAKTDAMRYLDACFSSDGHKAEKQAE